MTPPDSLLLDVTELRVNAGKTLLLRDISFGVHAGECLTLLGESGAGKSLLAQAIMGNLPRGLSASGRIRVAGEESPAGRADLRRGQWGRRLSLLPQEPVLALDPLMRLQPQLAEVFRLVGGDDAGKSHEKAREHLTEAGLGGALRHYPWQVSGGMAQRAAASMALAGGADILLADEPTKGLDRYWTDQVIARLQAIRAAGGCVIIITHDLRVARAMGGRLMVMQQGEVVEDGETAEVLAAPRHAFTRRLLDADPGRWSTLPERAAGEMVVEARTLSKRYGERTLFSGLDMKIHRHERVVLQGASGVGKSTLGNVLLGLVPPDTGTVTRNPALPHQALQKLYQDPVASFAPHHPLERLLRDACQLLKQPWPLLMERLERLKVPAALLQRRPTEISGGELQRVALARVLLACPALLFADEPTSRLDTVTQRDAMTLLLEAVEESDAALVLVTHDEDIARQLSTRILRFGDAGLISENVLQQAA